jgi:triphosphatase
MDDPMAREIELKLNIDPQQAPDLLRLPLLAETCEQGGRTPLHNQYFDTPDRLLAAHRVALRIREQGGRYIQTLKTRGSSQGGLHQRNEWEWDLKSAALDYSLLAQAQWPAALATPQVQRRIVPAFRTDFDRTTWTLRSEGSDGPVAIELALDHGQVTVRGPDGAVLSTPLSELELELKQGSAQDLYRVALELAASVALLPSDLSKAERGYRLLGAPAERPAAVLSAIDLGTTAAFIALAQGALSRTSRGLAAWQSNRDWQAVEVAGLAVRELQALLHCFGGLLKVSTDSALEQTLLKLCLGLERVLGWRRLQPYLDGGLNDAWAQQQAQPAARQLDALLRDGLPGRVLLQYGLLLQCL